MKKMLFLMSILTIGISSESYASKGYANDGLMLMLAVAGFLLVIAAILKATNYLRKNGRSMIRTAVTWTWRKIACLRDYLKKTIARNFDFSF
jgi:hypothetical protein